MEKECKRGILERLTIYLRGRILKKYLFSILSIFILCMALSSSRATPIQNITGCMNITSAGTYIFTGDLSWDGLTNPCINITADDVIIDGQGFQILGSTITNSAFSLMDGENWRNNITIKNVNLSGYPSIAGWGTGFLINKASNCSFINNSVRATMGIGDAYGGFGAILQSSLIEGNRFYSSTANDPIGIWLWNESSNNNIIRDNYFSISGGSTGICIYTSILAGNNTYLNNVMFCRTEALYFDTCRYNGNNVIGNEMTCTNEAHGCLDLESCQFNAISGNKISGTNHAIGFQVWTIISDNNLFYDNQILSGTNSLNFVNSGGFQNITFLNTTGITIIHSGFSSADAVNIGWYIKITAENSTDTLDGASVSVYNNTGNLVMSGITQPDGTFSANLTEYIYRNADPSIYLSIYNISITKTDYYDNSTELNISDKKNVEIFMLNSTTPSPAPFVNPFNIKCPAGNNMCYILESTGAGLGLFIGFFSMPLFFLLMSLAVVGFVITIIYLIAKNKIFLSILSIFILCMALSSSMAIAQPIKENVSIIWDSYVAEGSPNTNYGTSTELQIKNGLTSTMKRIYIMFDLSNYTNLTSISNAKICLYIFTNGATNNISIYTTRIGGTNLESTITWNNQPCGTAFNNATACNLTAQDIQYTTANNQFICWNVSFITQAVIDKNLSNITFALKSPENVLKAQDDFRSKDYTINTFRPYAEITYCTPNWIAYYTSCSTTDNYTKYYLDSNNCNSPRGFPADNGTTYACDYCTPNWMENSTACGTNINASCGAYDNYTKLYSDNNTCCLKTGLGSDCNTYPSINGTCTACNYCTPNWICGCLCGICNGTWIECDMMNDTNYDTCCALTGYDSDCIFTGDLWDYRKPCGTITPFMQVNQYPYIDCNSAYPIKIYLKIDSLKVKLDNLYIDIDNQTFNFTWNNATQEYEINLFFSDLRDYPFTIWNDYPLGAMENITGTFFVRCPYYLTFEVYNINPKNTSNSYKNINAYITAEYESDKAKQGLTIKGRSPYDKTLEQYITPIGFKELFNLKVFHAPYVNGQAQLKLWESNRTYAIRLLDGDMRFPDGQYSKINITNLYGTNIFLGTIYLNGTNETFQYYLTDQEMHPYKTLANWLFVISLLIVLGVTFALAIFVSPFIAMPFGLTLTFIIIVLRIIMWFSIG